MGDSGATRTLLTEEAAQPYQSVEFNPREEMEVVYGGGARGSITAAVQLGEVEALVVPGVQENLVALSDFTDRGSTVVLSDVGGVVSNSVNDKQIVLKKDFGTWRLRLSDIANYDHKDVRQSTTAFRTSTPKSKAERYIALHERLCHQSPKVLARMLDEEDPVCIRGGINSEEILQIGNKYTCVICELAKRRAKSVAFNLKDPEGFNGGINSKTAVPGQIISLDPVGPISPKSVGGFTLMWCVYDAGSSYQWVFFSTSKQASIVVEILRLVVADLLFFEKRLRIVRSDAEEIFNSREVQLFLDEQGIKHQYSVPYEHHQNRVERLIQHNVRGISTLMHSQKWLPASFWEYAAKHFVKVARYIPTKKTGSSTPSRLMGAGDLDLSVQFPFTFGDFVAVRIPSVDANWKFDLRRDLGIYLGDADRTKRGCLIYMLATGSVKVRSDCFRLDVSEEVLLSQFDARTRLFDGRSVMSKVKNANIDFEELPEIIRQYPNTPVQFTWSDLDGGDTSGGVSDSTDLLPAQIPNEESTRVSVEEEKLPEERTFRNLRNNPRFMRAQVEDIISVDWWHDHPFVRYKVYAYEAKVTVGSALKTAEASQWVEALRIEVDQLINTGTLEPTDLDDVPPGATIINSTMVLKKKPEKYKARWCACGNELKGKISELFSPTCGALTYSALHQMVIIDRMRVRVVDTVGAYLYQDYPSTAPVIYIRMPVKVMEALSIPANIVYKIKKYIYGLPDSGRAYYLAYSKLLMDAGYLKSKSDPCLFFQVDKSTEQRIYIWIHVDDTFVAATTEEQLLRLQSVIESQFNITVKHDVDTYLGVHFEYFPNGDVKLTQPKLLKSLFNEYEEELSGHRVREPISPQRTITSRSERDDPMDPSEYLHLEGALIYLTKSRPDIHTAVSFGATHSVTPTRGDFEELIHCLKYLQSTEKFGLILKAGEPNRDLILKCYVDASYLTHPDSKSHQGYCLSFGDVGTFYSKSSKQQLVATSSTQSEVKALQSLVVDIIFIVELCKELERPIKLPVIVFEDNGAVISLSREMTSRAKRCKHFLMAINWIREHVESGLIQLEKITDAENRADVLTKIITGKPFRAKAGDLLAAEMD